MKIRLAQINPIVGNLESNTHLIISTIKSSVEYDIIVFPELSLTGYPPQDLLLDSNFIHKTAQWLVFPHELTGLTYEEVCRGKPEIADIVTSLHTSKQTT